MTEEGRHPEAPRPKPDHDTIDPEEQARKMMGQDEPTEDYTEEERQAIVEDMTEQNQTQTDAQGLKQMTAVQQTIHTWTVVSERNGSQTAHTVDLRERTCTCEDMQYNSEGNEVCDHIVKAAYEADTTMDPGAAINKDLHTMVVELKDMVDDLIQQKTVLQSEQAARDAGETQDAGETSEGTDEPDAAPNLKAGELKNAFNDVVDDMRVEYTDHYVWVQTGPDSPDWAFEKFLQDPEQTYYIPDDYSGELDYAAKEKPGQWWKNAIKPEAVDEYINEVLK